MIIQHNMVADIANRQYNINNKNSARNAERLSSGYRVNRAADNAAGLSISEKMRSQVRGLHRASDNAWDGISLLRTADGAINESQAIIHRLRELSVQAANDTNTLDDRKKVQDEINSLITEVDRIAFDTEFNTIRLLDGSCEGDVSSNPMVSAASATGDITWVNVSSNPAVQSGSVTSSITAAEKTHLTNVLKDSIVPNVTNAILNRFGALKYQANNGNVSTSIGLELDPKDMPADVLAAVSMGYKHSSDGTINPNSFTLSLQVNTSSLKFSGGVLTQASRTGLEATIAHEMMHAFMDDFLTPGMMGASDGKLDSSNQFPLWFTEGMAQTLSGGFDPANPWCSEYKTWDVATIQSKVTNSDRSLANAATNTYGAYSTGYLACMYLGHLKMGGGAIVNAATIAQGINQIFADMATGATLNDVIAKLPGNKYTSFTDFEDKFGDEDSANFIKTLASAVGSGNGSILTGNLTQNDLISDVIGTSAFYVLDVTQTKVSSNAKHPWIAAGTGRAGGSGGGARPPAKPPTGSGGGSGGGPGRASGLLYLQIGANKEQDMSISIADCRKEALGLVGLSVLSHEEATEAIGKCDSALDKLSANRTQIGAYTNRLEYAIKNDDNASENMQAAESTIRDTDMATEMTQYSKNNILSQASQSMLAQAMSVNEAVLQLLQG